MPRRVVRRPGGHAPEPAPELVQNWPAVAGHRRTKTPAASDGGSLRALAENDPKPVPRRSLRQGCSGPGADPAQEHPGRHGRPDLAARAVRNAIAVLIGLPPAQFNRAESRDIPTLPEVPLNLPSQLLEFLTSFSVEFSFVSIEFSIESMFNSVFVFSFLLQEKSSKIAEM